jgi:cellulose synthase (UDP-forming)
VQDYYNIPVNDPLHQNLVLQHQRDQVVRDNHNAAWCIGSGLIFTREAWEAVKGFPEFSMCEDLFFGWALNGAGYKTVHVNACHQCGLQPDSFQYHEKQRRRWVSPWSR